MKVTQDSAKISRIISAVIVTTIFIEVINLFYLFMNSSGDQSTAINNLVIYAGMVVILCSVIFAVLAGRTRSK